MFRSGNSIRYSLCAALSLTVHSLLWWQPNPSSLLSTEQAAPSQLLLRLQQSAPQQAISDIVAKSDIATKVLKKETKAQTSQPLEPKQVKQKVPLQKPQPTVKPQAASAASTRVAASTTQPISTQKVTQKAIQQTAEQISQAISTDAAHQAQSSMPKLQTKPRFRIKPSAPQYPRIAKRKGQQGTVMVEIWLDAKGQQLKQMIVQSSGVPSLDQAALAAVKKWQFYGEKNQGIAIASRVKIPVRFELNRR